ncbi:MAG: tetratricopeptide repeat protein [Bacteroidia bacterium]
MEKLGKKLKAHQDGIQHDDRIEEVVSRSGGDGSVQDFIEQNKKVLLGLAVALVVLIAAVFAYRYYQGQQNTLAANSMFDAVQSFEAGDYNAALNGDSALNNMGLLDVADSYGSTEAGNLAKYYAGVAKVKQGDVAGGIDYLEDVSGSGTLLGLAKQVAIGFALEEQGDFEGAAKAFEAAGSAVGGNKFSTPFALLKAGENYEAAGTKGKALDLYKRIKDKYPESEEANNIDKYIGRASS